MKRYRLTLIACGAVAIALGVFAGCDDSTPQPATTTPTPEASTTDSPTTNGDSSTTTDASDGATTGAKPGVLHFYAEVAPQQIPDAGPPGFVGAVTTAGYPGAAEAHAWGVKAPQVVVPGAIPGIGCQAFKFNASNPPFGAPDEGNLSLDGFTGGVKLLVDGGGPLEKPAVCKRVMAPSGLFVYSCPWDNVPLTDFIAKTDKVKLTAAGGADIEAYSIDVNAAPYDAVTVTENLYGLTAADLDGSKDFTVNFKCDGAGCQQGAFMALQLETTDNATADNPYQFGAPIMEAGVAFCVDFAATHANTLSIPKGVVAALPQGWKRVRASVVVLNANQAFTPKMTPIALLAGVGQYGVSTHP